MQRFSHSKLIELIKRAWQKEEVYLMLAGAILFAWLSREYLTVASLNRATLLLLLPFVLIFFALWKKSEWNSKLLSATSIIIAILFFLFQNAYTVINKIRAFEAAGVYNCNVANTILSLENSKLEDKFVLVPFAPNLYTDMAFIYEYYGNEEGSKILNVVGDMQATNSLIETVFGLNIQGVDPEINAFRSFLMKMYNSEILESTKRIKIKLCDKK